MRIFLGLKYVPRRKSSDPENLRDSSGKDIIGLYGVLYLYIYIHTYDTCVKKNMGNETTKVITGNGSTVHTPNVGTFGVSETQPSCIKKIVQLGQGLANQYP